MNESGGEVKLIDIVEAAKVAAATGSTSGGGGKKGTIMKWFNGIDLLYY